MSYLKIELLDVGESVRRAAGHRSSPDKLVASLSASLVHVKPSVSRVGQPSFNVGDGCYVGCHHSQQSCS